MAAKKCLICNCSFAGRADARTCSPRCRKRLQQVRSELGSGNHTRGRLGKAAVLLILGLFGFLSILFSSLGPKVQAATTSSNLNFQARLLNSAGGIVPDGTYNIDFKIYSADSTTGTVGTCTSTCLWEETRKNFSSQGVQVINGYFSVNLGSVTAFPAINWDQQLWLTMNIGGTSVGASPTWDGEMQNSGHSVALTALPYAFIAGQLAATSGANRGTLSFSTVATNPNILLPDASGTVCLQSATACGFVVGTATNFIKNQTSQQTNANFNIQSAASGSIGGIITGAASQSVDIFDVDTNSNANPVFGIGSTGAATFRNASDSTTAFQIQSFSGVPLFTADTTNTKISTGGDLSVGTNYGNRLFSDSFESGSFSLWNSNNGLTIDSSTVHNGKYSAKETMSGTALKATVALSGGTSTIDWRMYVNLTSRTTQAILSAVNAGATNYQVFLDTSSHVCFWNGFASAQTCSSQVLPTSSWHLIDAHLTQNGASGSFSVTYDGTVIINATSQSTGSSAYNLLTLGELSASGQTATINYDDISVDTTTTGPAASLNVSDSLHVGGTTTLGGSVLIQPGSDSATAFQVQNLAGNNFIAVNSASSTVSLGDTGIASTVQVGNTSGAVAQTINVGNNTVSGATTIINVAAVGSSAAGSTTNIGNTTSGTGTQAINIGSNANSANSVTIKAGTTGAINLGTTGALTSSSTTNIANTSDGTGTQTVNIGSNANVANVLNLQGGTTGGVNIGAGSLTNIGSVGRSTLGSTFHIGDTSSSTGAQAVTIGSQANNTGDVTTIQGGSLTTGNGAIYLVAGSNGTNAGTITIGNTGTARIQQINIGTNATASSQANISIGSSIGGTTAITGPTTVTNRTTGASDTLNVSNSTSTGTIAKFSDNTTAVLTLADGGGATFENSSNSAAGFQIQNSSGSNLINVNTTDGYVVNNGIVGLDNQIENAGFESSGTTDGTGWFTPSATQVLTNSSANAHTGNYELQVTGNSTTHAVTTKWYAVHPGDIIYVEAWIKNSAAAPGDDGIYLEFADKDKGSSTFSNNDTGVPGTTYVLKSITATVPAGKTYVRVAASTKSTATSGTFYFDDFYMKRTNQQAPLLITNVSTTAFQVQNTSGATVLGVDSSGSKIFTTIADGTTAIGFTLTTPSYTTAGAKLFSLQNNTTEKFAVDKDGNITATGNVSIATGKTYQINGTQISSADLSNDANIAKLNGTGPQVFSGNNKFTGTVLAQSTSTTAFQVQNASNSIFTVDGTGNKVILGSGGAGTLTANLQFNFTGQTGSIALVPLNPTSTAYTLNLPAENGTVCTSAATSNANCTNFASSTSLTGKLNKGAVDTSAAAVTAPQGDLYAFTNSSSAIASGVLKLDNGNNTEAALYVTGTTDYATNKAYIMVNNTNVTPTGNLIDLQSNGADQFTVDAGGNVFANGNISINTGKQYQINGIQISSGALSDGGNLAKLNGTQTFTGANTFSNAGNAYTGDGSGITNINATNIATGTLNDGRLSANVALLNGTQTFTGANTFAPTANNAGQLVKQTSGTATSGSVLDVQTANGLSHFFQVTNAAANEGAVTLQSVGGTRDLTLNSGSGTIKIPSSTTGIQNTGSTSFTLDVQNGSNSTLFITNSSTGLASLDVEGGINIASGQTYKINNSQITSAALSNDSDIAKLSGTGPQIFTGNNKFTGTVLLKSSSASAFQIQQTATSTNLFAVDTAANTVSVGAPIIFNAGVFSSGTSATITQSLFDNNTTVQAQATAGGLTFTMPATLSVTTLGRLAYVTNTGAFPYILNYGTGSITLAVNSTITLLWNGGNWTGAGADAGTLQNAYGNSTGGTTPEVLLDTTRKGLDIQDANTSLTGESLFTVRASATATTLGASLFNILANGHVGINIGSTASNPTVTNDLSFGQIAGVTTPRTIGVEAQTTTNIGGNGLSATAGTGNGTGAGGTLLLQGGTSGTGAAAAGGVVNIFGGNAAGTGVSTGGNVVISGGTKAGSGTGGSVIIKPQSGNDSTTAFQVQNANSVPLITANTSNMQVTINGPLQVYGLAPPSAPALSTSTSGGTLPTATTYFYMLAAYNTSGRTNAVAASPFSVTTGAGAANRNILTWTAVTGATGYYLYRSTDGGNTFLRVDVGNVVTISDTGSSLTWTGTDHGGEFSSNPTSSISVLQGGFFNLDAAQNVTFSENLSGDAYFINTNSGRKNVFQAAITQFNNSNGTTVATIDNNGTALFKNSSNSTTAFQVQNAAGTTNVLTADTLNNRIGVNNFGAVATLDVGGNANIGGNSQNMLLRSEELDNAAWTTSSVTVTPNTTTAPNGTLTADTATASTTGHLLKQNVTVTGNTTYNFSFWAKSGTLSTTKYSVFDNTNSADIIAATAYTTSANWQRYSFSFTTPSNTTSVGVYPLRDSGVTGTVILWGAQLVSGASAGTYNQTVGSTVSTGATGLSVQGGTTINAIGSNNILQLQQDGKTVVNVGTNGATTFQNSTNSTTAFQIQNAAGNNIVAVDTLNKQIVLGSGDGATPSSMTVRGAAGAGSNIIGGDLIFDASNGTGAGGSGAFVFRTAAGVNGTPIAQDGTTHSASGTAVSSLSFTHNITSHTNEILLVSIDTTKSTAYATATTVTYNGVNMTQLTSSNGPNSTNRTHTELWYLKTPATGSAFTVQANFSSTTDASIGSVALYNVDLTNTFGTPVSTSGTGTAISVTVPGTTANQLVLDVSGNEGNNKSPAAGQNSLWNVSSNTDSLGGSDMTGVIGSTTMSWTITGGSVNWADLGVAINPVGGVGANSLTERLRIDQNGSASFQAANSTTAFQIKNATGTSLFGINSTNSQVTVNAGTIFSSNTYSSGSTSTITPATVNANTTVLAAATAGSLTFTVPSPTPATAGRLLYVTNNGANAFVINYGTGSFTLNVNSTVTLIWNGSAWTSAGADAGTLQTGYNNSSGGSTPDIKLDTTHGTINIQDADSSINSDLFDINGTNNGAGGLGTVLFGVNSSGTVRARTTTDSTTAFQLQNSNGASMLTLDDTNSASGNNLAGNSGAETSAGFTTNWPAAGFGTSTVSRDTTAGEFISGTASAKAVTTAASSGMKNVLTATLSQSTTYLISFSIKGNAAGSDLAAAILYNGTTQDSGTGFVNGCGVAMTITTSFTKVNCYYTTGSSNTFTSNNALAIWQVATGKTFFVDNLSVIQQVTTSTATVSQLKVGGAAGQGLVLLTADSFAGRPTTSSTPNAALLGSMYYDTTLGKMQCYEAQGWGYCGAAPDVSVNIIPEYTNAVLDGSGIGTLTSDLCSQPLAINGSLCTVSGQSFNYYSWNTIQPTAQSYSIFVRYQLPAAYKSIDSANPVSLYTRSTDVTSGDGVTLSMYDAAGTQCGSTQTLGTANAWTQLQISSASLSSCTLAANTIVLFKINVTATNGGTAYASNLSFIAKGQ